MNALEQLLDYPLGETLPAGGEALVVAPGEDGGLSPAVKWIRMALPFALNHINLWLLRDEIDGRQGWTVVDCCIDREESRTQWQQVIDTQLEGLPILRIIVTHFHPDHMGLAHWLCETWQAPLWMSATDYLSARLASRSTLGFGGVKAAAFFESHGLTNPESLEKIRGRDSYYPSMVPEVPPNFRRLRGGDLVRIGGRDWRFISGYGHAPEHMSLYCESLKVLISGDMMLPRISTNVSVHDMEPESNPLRLFLDSIDKFAPLDRDTLTLPAHGKPFRHLHERIRQLHEHHRERLAELLEACTATPHSAFDAIPLLFKRELDLHQMTFAMGESVAHLHLLWHAGQLRRARGADGVWRFSGARA